MNIYVGNLPYSVDEEDIRSLFEEFGDVNSVKLISDRETGRMKGFGFVDMEDAGGANAIENLDGSDFNGRNIKVNQARERTQQPRNNFNRF